jgi:hypothetical protein
VSFASLETNYSDEILSSSEVDQISEKQITAYATEFGLDKIMTEFRRGSTLVGETLLSHLFFVDDASLLAWDKRDMQSMLNVVADTCGWLGIEINLDKTEISAFDYGAGVEADTSMIRLKGRPILRLDPVKSFRYLGIRLPLCLRRSSCIRVLCTNTAITSLANTNTGSNMPSPPLPLTAGSGVRAQTGCGTLGESPLLTGTRSGIRWTWKQGDLSVLVGGTFRTGGPGEARGGGRGWRPLVIN